MLDGNVTQIRYFDTWPAGTIMSTDPAGITYHSPSGRLILADSEIDELPVFTGANLFEISLAGDIVYREIASGNREPTGIAYNAFDGFFYVTNDDNKTLCRYDHNLNVALTCINTTRAVSSADDPEDVTVDPTNGNIFVVHGRSGGRQVVVYDSNLTFKYAFSVASVYDPEGIAFDPVSRNLFLVSDPDVAIFEFTTTGTFVERYSLAGLLPVVEAPQGATFAPTSDPNDDPTKLSLYIVDGMIDNNANANERDGRVYEVLLSRNDALANQPPVNSVPGPQTIDEDSVLTFAGSTLISISDPDAGTNAVEVSLSVSHGTLSLSRTTGLTFSFGDGSDNTSMIFTGAIVDVNAALDGMTYTPTADFAGTAALTLVTDDLGNSGSGGAQADSDTVNLTINGINDAPSFTPGDNPTVAEDSGSVSIPNWATNISPGPKEPTQTVTFLLSNNSNPALFEVAPAISSDGTLSFTPAANAFGSATITVVLEDNGGIANGGKNTSAPHSLVITVSPTNDAPTISNINDQAIEKNTATPPIDFTIGDVDHAAADLIVTATSSDQTLLPDANIALGGTGTNRTITLTPATNRSGTATVTVTVSDGTASAADTFDLVVHFVNTPPSISDVADQVTDEDTTVGPVAFTVNDSETDPGSLVVTATSSNEAIVPNNQIVLGGSNGDRSVTITPAANQSGEVTITLSVSDGVDSVSDSFTLVIAPLNDPPTISDIADQTSQQNVTTGPIAFTVGDVDHAATDLTVSGSSSNPSLVPDENIAIGGSGTNRTVTVTPLANQSGAATITVTVSDGLAATTDTFVLRVNVSPTLSDVADQTIDEDTAAAIPFVVGDQETAAADLTVTGTSSDQSLVPNANITFSGSGENRTVHITPAANQFGIVTITLAVSDGTATSSDTFELTIVPQNDDPVAQNDGYSVVKGGTLTVTAPGLLANDSDVDNTTLSASLVTAPSNGTLTWNGDGSFTYVHNGTNTTSDTIEYQASDGTALSNIATVQITIDMGGPVTVSFQDGPGYSGTRDTRIAFDRQTTNYGKTSTLKVDGSPDRAALIKWDTSAIPAGSIVQSASITLRVVDRTPETYEVYAMRQNWVETEANWTHYAAGAAWSVPGADSTVDHGADVLASVTAATTGLKTFDFNTTGIAQVQAWVENPGGNYGIIVMGYIGRSNGIDFNSRETSTVPNRPKLTVTYIPPAGATAAAWSPAPEEPAEEPAKKKRGDKHENKPNKKDKRKARRADTHDIVLAEIGASSESDTDERLDRTDEKKVKRTARGRFDLIADVTSPSYVVVPPSYSANDASADALIDDASLVDLVLELRS